MLYFSDTKSLKNEGTDRYFDQLRLILFSFSLQNAFSIAIFIQFLGFCAFFGNRRTFAASFSIAGF